jgi:DNA repair exonuclease SbcCD nuclease subunit
VTLRTRRIVAVPDTHFPFVDQKGIDALLAHIAELAPDVVVQMGDLYDLYSFSSHNAPHYALSPFDELEDGRAGAEAFWAGVQLAAPDAECHQLIGNHDIRIRRKVQKSMPEIEALLDYMDLESLWNFKGVTTHSYRDVVDIDGIAFHHGYGKLGSHMNSFHRSTVVGHLHRGDVAYLRLYDNTIWELNAGFMGDRNALAFQYPPTKLMNWTTGYGVIDEYGPRFVAL